MTVLVMYQDKIEDDAISTTYPCVKLVLIHSNNSLTLHYEDIAGGPVAVDLGKYGFASCRN